MNDELYESKDKEKYFVRNERGATWRQMEAYQANKGLEALAEPEYKSGQEIQDQYLANQGRYAQQLSDRLRESWSNPGILTDESRLSLAAAQILTNREVYYFQKGGLSSARAERYQNLSHSRAFDEHARQYRNRSAGKRAGKAKDAAKAYRKVAEMQTAYEQSRKGRVRFQKDHYKDYESIEAITRQRIKAMEYAVQAKSTSKRQEKYAIQKGTLKNLLILKDSLDRIVRDNWDHADRERLEGKQAALNKEIESVKAEIDRLVSGGR